MAVPHEPVYSLLTSACFSRHPDALDWAASQLAQRFGKIALFSPDFSFHHTKYYDSSMGTSLLKRFLVFDELVSADCLPDVKHYSISLENDLAASGRFAESRPVNIDPGLVQLGKFLLASTKDQGHRIYLRDNIFAEVTLRFHAGAFDVWPWTYADYREEAVRAFLGKARALLYGRVAKIRSASRASRAM